MYAHKQTLHLYLSGLAGICANTESEKVSVYILECNTDHPADNKNVHVVLAVGEGVSVREVLLPVPVIFLL